MPATIPQRSDRQRMTALAEANRIRVLRAVLKREIASGDVNARARIADPPADLFTMKVIDVLLAMPSYGRTKANNVLRRAGVSPSKTLGGLSERQRQSLLSWLPR